MIEAEIRQELRKMHSFGCDDVQIADWVISLTHTMAVNAAAMMREALVQHVRCVNCGKCDCQHNLKGSNSSMEAYQEHIRSLPLPADLQTFVQEQVAKAYERCANSMRPPEDALYEYEGDNHGDTDTAASNRTARYFAELFTQWTAEERRK